MNNLEWLESYNSLVDSGMSQRKACKELGLSRKKVYRELLKFRTEKRDKTPRILLFDLESSPQLAYCFGRFKQNIGQDNIAKEGGYILTAVWKWLGEDTCYSSVANDLYNGDDSNVCAELYEAIEQADVVVAQNGDRFDIPLLKARLIVNGMPPLKTIKSVDTLKIAKQLRFPSNKLDSMGAYLGLGRKTQHMGMKLWIDVMTGCPDALQLMLEYNEQDVLLLEAIYLKLRAFDARPANLGLFFEDNLSRCPVCGSSDVEESGQACYTPVSKFAEVICNNCGHRSRKRQTLNTKEKRATLLLTPKNA